MLEINVTTLNANVHVTVVSIQGEIDSSTYKTFQAHMDEVLASGAQNLLLDLQAVPYISSAGLRVIHTLFNKLRDLHKDANDDELRRKMSVGAYKSPYIKVANLMERVREAFELSGFDVYIEVHNDVDSAVQSF